MNYKGTRWTATCNMCTGCRFPTAQSTGFARGTCNCRFGLRCLRMAIENSCRNNKLFMCAPSNERASNLHAHSCACEHHDGCMGRVCSGSRLVCWCRQASLCYTSSGLDGAAHPLLLGMGMRRGPCPNEQTLSPNLRGEDGE